MPAEAAETTVLARAIVECRNQLGEGCVWDSRDQCVYWTDIEGARVFRLALDGAVTEFTLPERAGFILPRDKPGFIIGFASRIARATADFKSFETLHSIETALSQTRVNDATIDSTGGIVFGTFDERDRQPVASVYRLAPDGSLRRLFGDVTIANGLAVSPDGACLAFADTPVGVIRRFKIGTGFGSLEEMTPLAGPDIAPGQPDGAIFDAEGHYWNARVWGGCLVRIGPDGRVSERISIPADGPTCVALGGADMTTLFATTLRVRLTEDQLAAQPFAGSLFACEAGIPGMPARLCAL